MSTELYRWLKPPRHLTRAFSRPCG
jgi:hypothetical protein